MKIITIKEEDLFKNIEELADGVVEEMLSLAVEKTTAPIVDVNLALIKKEKYKKSLYDLLIDDLKKNSINNNKIKKINKNWIFAIDEEKENVIAKIDFEFYSYLIFLKFDKESNLFLEINT